MRTFGEKACLSIFQMLAQVPPIAKVIISFNELYFVTAGETELVRAAGLEIICAKAILVSRLRSNIAIFSTHVCVKEH